MLTSKKDSPVLIPQAVLELPVQIFSFISKYLVDLSRCITLSNRLQASGF